MTARDIMTTDPATCAPHLLLPEVARLMCDNDCGAIPVVDASGRCMGVVTDRDIACRVVAQGKDALQYRAEDCMSSSPITVTPETSVDECCRLLEKHQIRRLVVADGGGVCGMISQADVARIGADRQTAELVRNVSMETGPAAVPPRAHA
jgi:CBS domain-containing protein